MAISVIAGSAKGALISNFDSFSTQLLPPMFISWNNGADQYTQSSGFVSITPVSGGNPSGDGSFVATLPGNSTMNFTGISLASLNARVDSGNASSSVKVTFLDNSLTSVATATFFASSFTSSFSTQTTSLSFTGVGSLAAVTYWRMDGDSIASDAFRYSFNDLNVAAVPEPSPSLLLGLAGIGCLGLLARKNRLKA